MTLTRRGRIVAYIGLVGLMVGAILLDGWWAGQ